MCTNLRRMCTSKWNFYRMNKLNRGVLIPRNILVWGQNLYYFGNAGVKLLSTTFSEWKICPKSTQMKPGQSKSYMENSLLEN